MNSDIRKLLENVKAGVISIDDAVLELKKAPYEELGYAKIDMHRNIRQGFAEVIYGASKTPEQILGIVTKMLEDGQKNILITRMSREAYEFVNAKVNVNYNSDAKIGIIGTIPSPDGIGRIIVAVCKLIRDIAPDHIIASRLCTGYGTVHCAHGILPVPAPATANIIEGLPAFGGSEEGERLTPTGAALIKHFASEYSSMPEMVITKTGYGVGTKEFKNGNFVRAFLGESVPEDLTDKVIELAANIDDMTAEQIAFATEMLYESGAVEVFTTPVTMKKSRPGTLITAICPVAQKESVVSCFFKHTSTIGIRERSYTRHILSRSIETRSTEFGDVRYKVSTGYGVTKVKPEYDDVARIARENDMSIEDVKKKIME